MSKRFSFPNPVNETSARLVAGGVVLISATYLITSQVAILVLLAYGFAARVAAGPTFSPLALISTRIITPRLHINHKFVAGPPKRFAQFIGLIFSVSALILELLSNSTAAKAVIIGLVFAASCESVLAVCFGCLIFQRLIKFGLIPAKICESCVV